MTKNKSGARSTGKFILAFALLYAIALFVFDHTPGTIDYSALKDKPRPHPILTEQSITHILYGDEHGGGHKFGAGKPCKSEFPLDWSEEDIITTVQTIAANDNLPWRKENNDYFVAETMKENIKVRVVLNQSKTRIITAYPTNTQANPCPANNN